MAQPCAPGMDCALLNSCPSYYVACPDGYFCSSYQSFPDESGMDYDYAIMKMANNDAEVTRQNAIWFIDPDRAIQNRCLNSFYCENVTEMASCPSGHWCAESTVAPRPCGLLSICPENSYYEVNFTNLLLGVLAATCLLVLSSRAVHQQRRKDSACRNTQTQHGSTQPWISKEDAKIGTPETAKSAESISITLNDAEFFPKGSAAPVIHNFSASLPAGKLTMILGPSGCGKTSLLNLIRTGGAGLTNGQITFHLHRTADGSQHLPSKTLASSWSPEEGTAAATTTTADIRSPLLALDNDPTPLSTARRQVDAPAAAVITPPPNRIRYDAEFSRRIGLVPQDDILDRKLTVREYLLFHALTRSQKPLTSTAAAAVVQKTLHDLGIAHIAEAVIGGGENAAANISGGQLKRVNIACELVAIASPGILLLDEPTSGLDAAVAYELMDCMEALKEASGITIVCVLQQPRHEIFVKMDHLLLVHPSGTLVYAGRPQEATTYLRTVLGKTPYSHETSDADFCIDVLNAMKVEPESEASSSPQRWPSKQQQQRQRPSGGPLYQPVSDVDDDESPSVGFVEVASVDGSAAYGSPTTTATTVAAHHQTSEELRLQKLYRYQPFSWAYVTEWIRFHSQATWAALRDERFYRQIYIEAQRLIMVRLRDRVQLVTAMIINVLMAVSLSTGFSIFFYQTYSAIFKPPVRDSVRGFYPSSLSQYADYNANDYPMQQLLFFTGATLGCGSCLAAIPVFSGMIHVAQREHTGGVALTAYAIGRMLGDLPFVMTMALVFCGTWCSFGMPGYPGDWLLVICGTAYAASAIGYLASTFSSAKNASVNAILLTFLCAVFSGVEPKLRQVERWSVISYPWYLSFATWTSEATYVTWAQYLHDDGHVDEPIQEGASVYGYDVSHGLGRSIGALLALGTLLRLVVLVLIQYY